MYRAVVYVAQVQILDQMSYVSLSLLLVVIIVPMAFLRVLWLIIPSSTKANIHKFQFWSGINKDHRFVRSKIVKCISLIEDVYRHM